MERLTYFDNGKWRLKIGDTEYSGNAVDRLAAYENTGLDPDQIQAVLNDAAREFAEYDAAPKERLCELAQADKESRCVLLPCKVGATVYIITTQSDDFSGERMVIVQAQFRLSLLQDIGKTVFLTRAEAEQALKVREQHG